MSHSQYRDSVSSSAGELLFFGSSTIAAPYCVYGRADAAGRVLSAVEVPLQQAVLMHDFAITQRFAVFIDGSLVMDTAVRRGLCCKAAEDITCGVGVPTALASLLGFEPSRRCIRIWIVTVQIALLLMLILSWQSFGRIPCRLTVSLVLNTADGRDPDSHSCAMRSEVHVCAQAMVKHNTMPMVYDNSQPARIGLLRRDAADAFDMQWFDVRSG